MSDLAAARRAMVDSQVRPSDVTRYALIEAMLTIPRESFLPRGLREVAYAEAEAEVGTGRYLATPRTLAKMIEAADVGPSDLVLELAPGTGYSTAVLAHMAEAVVAIEPEGDLVKRATEALAALEIDNAVVTEADPAAGDADHGPYDVIFINGAIETLPEALVSQLKEGGRLVAIVTDGATSRCVRYTKTSASVSQRAMFDASAHLLNGFERAKEFTL